MEKYIKKKLTSEVSASGVHELIIRFGQIFVWVPISALLICQIDFKQNALFK